MSKVKETNYQVAVEKTLIRLKEGETMDCYKYNMEVLQPKWNTHKMSLIKHLKDLKYYKWMEYLEDYTDRGDDDFENYDEYALDYLKDQLEEFIRRKVDETEYTQEVMDEWDNDKYPD